MNSPIKMNTVGIVSLAMIAALGSVIRFFVRIPVIPEILEITPGFLFSELGGVVGGIPGGIFVGAIVGMSGAMAGGEFPILPLIGNIALGVGTGFAIHVRKNRDSYYYMTMAILGGGIIGGFIPTFAVSLYLAEVLEFALFSAFIDGAQALAWAAVAVFVERTIVRPLIGHYIYAPSAPETQQAELHEE